MYISKSARQLRKAFSCRPSLLLPLLYMTMILAASSIPGTIPDDAPAVYEVFRWVPPAVQNLLHIPVYAGLGFLWAWYFAGDKDRRCGCAVPLMITVGFGILDEWYQFYIPGRYASSNDVLFNIAGALIGVSLFRSLRHSLPDSD